MFLSPGFFSFDGRDETTEGLDKQLTLSFYARWKFVIELMPLLRAAREAGEDARVVTVFGAGSGGKLKLDDMALKENWSLSNFSAAAALYNDLMVEVRLFGLST